MAQVAVDLSPVVSSLLERPFDQPSLDRAYAAVGGHPQAYATALRCAAKKTRDSLAAAYWFAEAARIHETMDDLGGAIALLWRAFECDRSNPRPRELLAAAMVRLSMRAGLAFTFTPAEIPAAPSRRDGSGRAGLDTGLRPPPPPRRFRDTVPEVFGNDPEDPDSDKRLDALADGDDGPITGTLFRATLPSALLVPPSVPSDDEFPLVELEDDERVQQLLPPPKNPSSESGIVHVTRGPTGEPVLRSIVDATIPPVLSSKLYESGSPVRDAAIAASAPVFPEAGPKVAPMPSIVIGPEPKTPAAPVSAETLVEGRETDDAGASPSVDTADAAAEAVPSGMTAPATTADAVPPPPVAQESAAPVSAEASPDAPSVVAPSVVAPSVVAPSVTAPSVAAPSVAAPAIASLADEVYAEDEAPPTLRPAGDRLVGGLFEALHGLHFLAEIRQGAAFVCRTLMDKMRPATMLVHLYDINSGHYLIVSAEGNRAAALVDYPTPEDDAFIVEVMKSDDSTLVQNPTDDPRFSRGRWALVEPRRSVLCAPIVSEGRHLGLLELSDPDGGGAFTEDDRNALMYAASALSRFIDRRGLVLSDEPERSSPSAAAH